MLTSTGNYIPSLSQRDRDLLPTELLFNGFAYQAGSLLGRGPLRDAANEFDEAYRAAGATPNPVGALAWDPAKLLISAVRTIGISATAAQVQHYLAGLQDFAGVMGTYDCRHRQMGSAPRRGCRSESPRRSTGTVTTESYLENALENLLDDDVVKHFMTFANAGQNVLGVRRRLMGEAVYEASARKGELNLVWIVPISR